MEFFILKDASPPPAWPAPSRAAPACTYWHTVTPLTAAGTSTRRKQTHLGKGRQVKDEWVNWFHRKGSRYNYDGLSYKAPRLTHCTQTEDAGARSNNRVALSYADSTRQESEGREIFWAKRWGNLHPAIANTAQCFGFFSFQKKLHKQQENTPKSLLPFPPSGKNSPPDTQIKPQKPGSSPKFSLQYSRALESSTIQFPPPTTGGGT